MNTDVKMPLAVHKGSGGLMRVQDVPRGLDCCCVCGECGQDVVARKGDILEWHFAHYHNNLMPDGTPICQGGTMTLLHRFVQEHIASTGCVLPLPPEAWEKGDAFELLSADGAQYPGSDFRSDVAFELWAHWAGITPETVHVEVVVSHSLGHDKRRFLTKEITCAQTRVIYVDLKPKRQREQLLRLLERDDYESGVNGFLEDNYVEMVLAPEAKRRALASGLPQSVIDMSPSLERALKTPGGRTTKAIIKRNAPSIPAKAVAEAVRRLERYPIKP